MLYVILAAWAHHVLAFLLVALLAVEIALLRPGLSPETLRRLGRVDLAYGATFGLLLAVGLVRVLWTEKGWTYYLDDWPFEAKMTALLLAALLSIWPTVRLLRWNRDLRRSGAMPADGAVGAARRVLLAEALLLVPVPLFAAMMARGL